jgi:FkbM family methyltransferase
MGPIKSAVWFWIHRHRRNRAVARFVRLCKNIHRASEHPGYDADTDGERDVLARTVSGDSPVLFDVGANLGDWSKMALESFPKATIHAFELNPKLVGPLVQRFSNVPLLRVHSFGLAASAGEVDFFAYAGDSTGLSSLRVPLHSHVPHQIQRSTVRTGDEVCRELGVGQIDFLKIDVEGAEYEVLTGFSAMLQAQHVSVLQFEHQSGRYLRDFYDFLVPKGYALGKLYANYVDFRSHSAELEHFLGPHYVALPASRKPLIELLQQGW